MSTKKSVTALVGGAILLFAGLFCFWRPSSVLAQCGNPPPSSCTTCHAQEYPVNDEGEWHAVHARQDICINCHGGNGSTMDQNLAHEGMTANPLSDIYTDCHGCHPDYVDRAVPYAATLQITPSSCATPTSVAAVSNVVSGLPPSGVIMQSNLVGTSSAAKIFLFIAGGLTLLVLFCIGACWLGEHHVKSQRTQ
ncbi:MAG TPA: hypothetical protein VLX61_16480 [Anaerolineales bacterium]|nr:hypothetical protein [Anaerolineales bacterium]